MAWEDNMSKNSSELESFSGEDFTCISFELDLKRFNMNSLNKDFVSLMRKRVKFFD